MGASWKLNRVQHQMNFPGISQARFTPPDPTLAVGPNHVVEMVNSEIAFFAKDGTMQFQNTLDSTGFPRLLRRRRLGRLLRRSKMHLRSLLKPVRCHVSGSLFRY